MTLDPTRTAEPPLLRTKITAPRLSPEFVHRPRLTERINRGVRGPLTLLAAPAGYGKTNLLLEWMEKTALPVAWLNVDRDDNDLNRFYRYLVGAFQTLEPHFGEEALDFIESTRGSGLEVGLTLLINEIFALPRDVVLVLDDFQALTEPAILQSAGFLLRNLPPNLHLIVASRGEPALELATLRAKGRVIELGMEDLRFTGEEVAQFFQQAMELALPPDTISALEKRTDGWITGLQMAAISLRHQTDPTTLLANLQGDAHYLVDFLAEEVLDRQPEEIRQFLLRSSILKLLSGPLCEAVVKPDAQPGYGIVMLNRLEHANLFIVAYDEKHEWFRYHNLFADFLLHIQAEINPAEIPVLQKRAALWFEQNANLDEAFQYALASGDLEWTADLVERNIEAMIKTGEIFSLTRWISKLPDETIRKRPGLSLTYAWGAIAAYEVDQARYWIEDLQQTLDRIEKQQENGGFEGEHTSLWNTRGGLAVCKSTLALLSGDAEQAAEYSEEAASYLGEDNPFIHSLLALDDSLYHVLSGDTQKAIASLRDTLHLARQANNLLVMAIATCQLADMQALQGQLNRSWGTLQKAQYMAIGPGGKTLPLAGLADVGLGEILLERNDLAKANEYLARGLETTGRLWWLSNLDGMVSLARLRQAQGDVAGSQAIIAEASRMAISTQSSQWDDVIVSAIAVRLALRRDDLPGAEQRWQKSAFPDILASVQLGEYPYHIYEYIGITQARLLAALGRSQGKRAYLERAAELMDALLVEARQFRRVTSQIEIQVVQAIVQSGLGEVDRAVATLRNALAAGEPEGYRRIYLDGGPTIAGLMAQHRDELCIAGNPFPSRVFVDSLLEDFEGEFHGIQGSVPAVKAKPEVVQLEDGLPVVLSAREMEVLKLIAEGKSNQEISAQLYLALNTVKRHAYNIYSKLGVEKRTQAVSKARGLGLIE